MTFIAEGQKISFKNVASKYYEFDSSETGSIVENFFKIIDDKKLTPNGPLFYSIQSDIGTEPILAIYSIPIEEDHLPDFFDEDLDFQTYFLIDNMIMTRANILSDSEADEKSKEMVGELIEYVSVNNMEIQSQFYNMIRIVDDKIYLEVYLKATRLFKDEKSYESFFKKIKNKFSRGGDK
ncbi:MULTISPECIES: DUF5085 family protein [unclassified Enterococcus]|uniref:DUF5085 family protein n=1 Tax=unclassified Enterococcus TaxID=2608891 RepID=UPI001CE12DBB|nr:MULTISPECIES: DUF5085 family protein [unclassified Enterococcus]MCA5014311.1 DUF5085 family protein [Enterococcus sp. S23]MCA5017722.1 DUF5085 family protein [Enterococcus sp. S22(2020)]